MFQIYEFLPGAVTRTKQWDNLHYHNVLLELFFFLRIHYHMQNKWIYMTLLMIFTENNYLCDEINELDGFLT